MRGEIIKLQKRLKTTLVYVTHDQVEAMSMADRITILNDGRIQQVGTPSEVYDTPRNKFVAGFIGSPTMNFIDCVKIGKTLQFGDNILNLIEILDEKASKANSEKLIFGFRPEHTKITSEPHEGAYKVRINVIEYLGAQTVISFEFPGKIPAMAISPGFYSANMGDDAYISFPIEKTHIFDPETNMNLVHEIPLQKIL